MLKDLLFEIEAEFDRERAEHSKRFFKTGKGEYGEGDVFYGLSVPKQRKIAKKYENLSLKEIQELLNSKVHEHRLTGLIILVNQFKKGNQKKIYDLYLSNTHNINNWDLVDVTAHHIVGGYLFDKKKDILYSLSKSKLLWERRISIIATFYFIKKDKFEDTLKISEILVYDKHDLIQKAVGWMLREIGKRNQDIEEGFLKKYYKTMPRTMLRYAIERFSREKRDFYLGRKN